MITTCIKVLLATLSISFLMLACTSMKTVSEPMSFIVGFDDSSMMEGVRVILIRTDGQLIEIGQTDAAGYIGIDKNYLRQKGLALIFCQEGFFCGSFLLRGTDFFDYQERYIELAPIAWL